MIRKAFQGMIALVILATTFAAPSPGKDGTVPSSWAPSPPRIDGKADDWAGADLAHWDKGDVDYAFRNDADRLYVLLVFRNPKFLSTIGETGIRLYFGTAGKKDKGYAVQFIRRQVPVEEAIAFIERERPVSDEEKAQLRAKPAYNIYDHLVLSKKAKSQPVPPATAFPPAHFRFAPDQKAIVYELEIPLARGHELAAGVGSEPGEAVMVGFEWGGPTEEQLKKAARASGETSIANEEVSRGSVDRMDRTKSGPLPPKYSFWVSVQLAAPAD
jgi:hypothetical protein